MGLNLVWVCFLYKLQNH